MSVVNGYGAHTWSGGGDAAKKCRLAGVGKAHETHVGQQLEGETQAMCLACIAGLGGVGGLPRGGCEARVAAPPAPAARHHHALGVSREVCQQGIRPARIVDEGAQR